VPRYEGILGSGGEAARIRGLGTRWRWVVSFTPRPLYPQGKTPCYTLNRRLGGPQSRSIEYSELKPIQDPSDTFRIAARLTYQYETGYGQNSYMNLRVRPTEWQPVSLTCTAWVRMRSRLVQFSLLIRTNFRKSKPHMKWLTPGSWLGNWWKVKATPWRRVYSLMEQRGE